MVCVYETPSLKCAISETQHPSQARTLQTQIEKKGLASVSDSACSANKQPSSQTGSNIMAVPNGPKTCQFPACGWVAAMGTLRAKEVGSRILQPVLFLHHRRSGYIA